MLDMYKHICISIDAKHHGVRPERAVGCHMDGQVWRQGTAGMAGL